MKTLTISVNLFVLITFVIALNIGVSEAEDVVHPEVPRISASEVKDLFYKGKLILANCHPKAEAERGHIIGAIMIPQGSDFDKIYLPTDKIVAFYCC